jgi:hypothetical protein
LQYASIQAAVDAVRGPTTIVVSPGLYAESVVVDEKAYVVIQSAALSRRGVTLAGGEGVAVVVVRRSAVHLSGISIRSNARLRGIRVEDATLSLQECTVAGNRIGVDSGGAGAGMECLRSLVRIQKSTVVGNTIDTFGSRVMARGAGLFFDDCRIEIAGSTIQANEAYADVAQGGGIWCDGGRMRMWRSRVTENALSAGVAFGGGIYFKGAGRHELGGSVISANGFPEGKGGGIYIEDGASGPNVHRNTVVRQNHPDDVWSGIEGGTIG